MLEGAPPWCLDMRPKLAAGGFKKSNSLKSRPAHCQGSIPIANGTLVQAQLPSQLRRRAPQVLPWRLLGHLLSWFLGVCAPGPNRASGDSMVGGLPRKWHHMRPVSGFCASGSPCRCAMVRLCSCHRSTCCGVLKARGALPLLYAGSVFGVFLLLGWQTTAENRARI